MNVAGKIILIIIFCFDIIIISISLNAVFNHHQTSQTTNYTTTPEDLAAQSLQEKFKNSTVFTKSLDNSVNNQYTNLNERCLGKVKEFSYNYYIINSTSNASECYLTLTVYWKTDSDYGGVDNWNLTGQLYYNYNNTTHNFTDPYYQFLGNSTSEVTQYPDGSKSDDVT